MCKEEGRGVVRIGRRLGVSVILITRCGPNAPFAYIAWIFLGDECMSFSRLGMSVGVPNLSSYTTVSRAEFNIHN